MPGKMMRRQDLFSSSPKLVVFDERKISAPLIMTKSGTAIRPKVLT
jgi:hypothetical protein